MIENSESGNRLLKGPGPRPTAVFAHNDLMAVGALGVFRSHGISCPGDVSLVGYNDSPMIDQVEPPLTTVAYPGTEVGETAGRLALQLVARSDRPAPNSVFAPTILVRSSTAPPDARSAFSA